MPLGNQRFIIVCDLLMSQPIAFCIFTPYFIKLHLNIFPSNLIFQQSITLGSLTKFWNDISTACDADGLHI